MALARLPGYTVIWPTAARVVEPGPDRGRAAAEVTANTPPPVSESESASDGLREEIQLIVCDSWAPLGAWTALGPDAVYMPVPVDLVDWRACLRFARQLIARLWPAR